MISRCGSSIPPAPFSSLDSAVSTKCFPPSDQQNEKDEDAFSVSSISDYSSVEWVSTDGEGWLSSSDEDDVSSSEDKKADMTESCLHSQSMEEKKENNLEKVEDEILERGAKRPRTTEQNPLFRTFSQMKKDLQDNKPPKHIWIDSWPEKIEPGFTWLSVYGYCSKTKGYGGYGVYLRNRAVQPIVASACFQREGGSQLFQVLKGLQVGLELALKYRCTGLYVGCNTEKAVNFLGHSTFERAGSCFIPCCTGEKELGICKDCTKRCLPINKKTPIQTLIPVIRKLIDVQANFRESRFTFNECLREKNEPAHYLAKMAKRNALKPNPSGEESKEIKPVDFPGKLKEILWEEAFGCITLYSHSLLS